MKRTVVRLTDDLDGSEAAGTIEFGLDGVEYAIDLSEANTARLREVLAKHVGAARRTGERKAAANTGTGKALVRKRGKSDSAEIREWAKEQGIAVNERGRISADVTLKFSASH